MVWQAERLREPAGLQKQDQCGQRRNQGRAARDIESSCVNDHVFSQREIMIPGCIGGFITAAWGNISLDREHALRHILASLSFWTLLPDVTSSALSHCTLRTLSIQSWSLLSAVKYYDRWANHQLWSSAVWSETGCDRDEMCGSRSEYVC